MVTHPARGRDDGTTRGAAVSTHHGGADPELMAQRYGRRSSRRATVVVAGIAALLVLAWVVWQAVALTGNTATSENVAVEIVDPGRVDVTFSVITDPGTTVSCRVRAVSSTFAEVGVREVTLGPVEERVTTVTVQVSTVEEATSGEVLGCDIVEE